MTDTAGIPGDRICAFIERLREILRLRKQDKDERDEQESLLDLYLRAMESVGASQAKAA
jgi:hypothetical protein